MSNLSTFFGAAGGGAGGALGGTMRAFTANCTVTVPSNVCAIAYGVMGGGGRGCSAPQCRSGGGAGFSWYEETGITLPAPVSTPVVVGAPDTGSGAGTSCVTFPCQTICATGGNFNGAGSGSGGLINTSGANGRAQDNSGGSGAGGLFGDGGCGGSNNVGGGGGFGSGGGGGIPAGCGKPSGGPNCSTGGSGTPGFITGFVGGNFSASKTLWGASGGGGGGGGGPLGFGGNGGAGGGGGASNGPNSDSAGNGGFGAGGGAANNHCSAGLGGCGGGSGTGSNPSSTPGGGGFVTVEFWETSS